MSSELPPSDRLSDLLELARRAPDELAARIERLTLGQKVELALRVPPARRLDLLLHARRPREVVRALPDAELYLTVREVGPTDALPLLALASTEQLLHVLDLESWRGDRFDADRAGAWLALVLEADERATTRLLRALDDQVLALVLHDWIRIKPIENENEMAETGGSGVGESGDDRGQVTPDGHYWFSPSIVEHAPAIRRILQLLFVDDRARYDRLLWQALWETSAELEEQAMYWRQSRLEEHGYPTPEDALAIYAPPSGTPVVETPPAAEPSATPVAILRSPRARTVLVPAVDRLGDEARDRVLFEFVALANRVLVADGADAGDPAAHKAALETAAGYVTIALEARDAADAARAASVLAQASTIELFREGYARAAELGARARALVHTGWASEPRALELLDPPIRETVERLLEPRPRTARGTAFATLAEIETSRAALELAEVVGHCLLEGVGFDARRLLPDHPLSTALLTLLAWHATRQTISTDPLPPDAASDFARTIASRRTAAPDAGARALDRLVQRLAQDQRLGARDIAVVQAFGRFCLERLADECGDLDPGVPLDRRAVACLLLA